MPRFTRRSLILKATVVSASAAIVPSFAVAAKDGTKLAQNPRRATRLPRSIADRARKIIVEHLGVEMDEVTNDKTWEELGADSLDLVELVMAAEDEFKVEIPDDTAEELTTVGEAIAWIEKNAT